MHYVNCSEGFCPFSRCKFCQKKKTLKTKITGTRAGHVTWFRENEKDNTRYFTTELSRFFRYNQKAQTHLAQLRDHMCSCTDFDHIGCHTPLQKNKNDHSEMDPEPKTNLQHMVAKMVTGREMIQSWCSVRMVTWLIIINYGKTKFCVMSGATWERLLGQATWTQLLGERRHAITCGDACTRANLH